MGEREGEGALLKVREMKVMPDDIMPEIIIQFSITLLTTSFSSYCKRKQ